MARASCWSWSVLLGVAVPVPAQLAVGSAAPTTVFAEQLNAPPGVTELADLRGAAILVEFWATWCGPCKAQIPHLQQLHDTYAERGLVVVAVTEEPLAKAQPFAERNGMRYPVVVAAGAMAAWRVRGIPSAFLIDPDGKIAWAGHPGALQNEQIEKHLAGAWSPLQRLTDQLSPVQDLLDRDQRGKALAMLELLHRGGKLDAEAGKRAAALALCELKVEWQGRPETETAATRLQAMAKDHASGVRAAEHTLQAQRHARRKELDQAEVAWNAVLAAGCDDARARAEAGLAAIAARRASEPNRKEPQADK